MKRFLFILFFIFLNLISWCADRYWVGGTATWNSTAGTKWATTSGGAGGAAVPTSSDAVFFDGNSGSGTISVENFTTASFQAACAGIDCTGFTGTFTSQSSFGIVNVSGNLTLATGMTVGTFFNFNIIASSTINFNGKSFPSGMALGASGGTFNLASDITVGGTSENMGFSAGTLNTNNYNITCGGLSCPGGTVNLGSSTITILGTSCNFSGSTLSAGTSLIKLTNTSNTSIIFPGGGQTFNNVWFNRGGSTGTLTITGTNTFNDFKDDGTAAHTITFPNVTTTITTFTVSGTSGNLITLARTGGSGTFTLSQATGSVCRDYLSISNSTATGGASWYAGAGSTDGGGNTGWTFTACPSGNNSKFFFKP